MREIIFVLSILALAGINVAWALFVVPDRPIRFLSWSAAAVIIISGIVALSW